MILKEKNRYIIRRIKFDSVCLYNWESNVLLLIFICMPCRKLSRLCFVGIFSMYLLPTPQYCLSRTSIFNYHRIKFLKRRKVVKLFSVCSAVSEKSNKDNTWHLKNILQNIWPAMWKVTGSLSDYILQRFTVVGTRMLIYYILIIMDKTESTTDRSRSGTGVRLKANKISTFNQLDYLTQSLIHSLPL